MIELDLTGLNCPLPVLKTKKFLANLAADEIIKVITTDLASLFDLQEFCKKTGHIMISQNNKDGIIESIIKHK